MNEEKRSSQRQADRSKINRSRSVLVYLVILFAAAVILLLLAYLMQQRSSEQTIDGLKQSISSMQSAQDIYDENIALREQLEQLEEQAEADQSELDRLRLQVQSLQQQADSLERTAQAMDWFWQINEAYVRGRTTLARQLIEQMGDELPQYLPMESVTNNDRFSPYDRYQEICDALN